MAARSVDRIALGCRQVLERREQKIFPAPFWNYRGRKCAKISRALIGERNSENPKPSDPEFLLMLTLLDVVPVGAEFVFKLPVGCSGTISLKSKVGTIRALGSA